MFVFVGYLLTSMWVPAMTGLFVVVMMIMATVQTVRQPSQALFQGLSVRECSCTCVWGEEGYLCARCIVFAVFC